MTAQTPDLTQLFSPELIPVIRRMGERARADTGTGAGDDAVVRKVVWSGLADLGLLAAAAPTDTAPFAPLSGCLAATEVMGTALYQGLFFDTLAAADVIAAGRDDELLAAVSDGRLTVSVAVRQDGLSDPAMPGPLRYCPRSRELTAARRFVPYAAEADLILVIGAASDDDGTVALLVAPDQPGVRLRRQCELGRGELYAADFDAAAARPLMARMANPGHACGWPAILARARLRHASYLVGLSSAAVDLTVSWARQRQVFGRPLAQCQAPAFRLAALAARAAAVRALIKRSAAAADDGADIRLMACQALMLAADLALDASAEAVQLHGSAGLLETSDPQLFYRRAIVDSMMLGTGRQLRAEAVRHGGDPGRNADSP
jgi:alkylation response protein AidB-like acyl-CoA dehydrogenase